MYAFLKIFKNSLNPYKQRIREFLFSKKYLLFDDGYDGANAKGTAACGGGQVTIAAAVSGATRHNASILKVPTIADRRRTHLFKLSL